MTEYLLCLILFSIGLYCILVKRNLIKIIIGLGIMEYSINLFFILLGYKARGQFPILSKDMVAQFIEPDKSGNYIMVDPIPQALILTAIVIGLAVTCFLVAIALKKKKKYNIRELRQLKG